MKRILSITKPVIFSITILFFISEMKAQLNCPNDICTPPPSSCKATEKALSKCDFTPPFTPKVSISNSFLDGPTATGGISPVSIAPMWRTISTNEIPNHTIGNFGSKIMTPCGRPTSLKEQEITTYRIPLNPGISESGSKEYVPLENLKPFGIAKNGILFDPFAAEWYKCNPETGWQQSALDHPDMENELDCNNAHIQPDGAYHYHGLPVGLYKNEGGTYPIPDTYLISSNYQLVKRNEKIVLLGWGFDGVPVYGPLCYQKTVLPLSESWWKPQSGYTLRKRKAITDPITGRLIGVKDICEPNDAYTGNYDKDWEYTGGESKLDQCNGHFAPTSESSEGIYHYHITETYPYIPRCYTKMK